MVTLGKIAFELGMTLTAGGITLDLESLLMLIKVMTEGIVLVHTICKVVKETKKTEHITIDGNINRFSFTFELRISRKTD